MVKMWKINCIFFENFENCQIGHIWEPISLFRLQVEQPALDTNACSDIQICPRIKKHWLNLFQVTSCDTIEIHRINKDLLISAVMWEQPLVGSCIRGRGGHNTYRGHHSTVSLEMKNSYGAEDKLSIILVTGVARKFLGCKLYIKGRIWELVFLA